MPLYAYIAGSASSVATLAEYMEQTFKSACEELADTYHSRRTAAEYSWDGFAGSAAANQITGLLRAADALTKASTRMGLAIDAYANSLRKAQSHIANAREIATAGRLPVNDETIEGPPEPPDSSWEAGSVVSLPPAQEAIFQAWVAEVEAWNSCVNEVDLAFDILEQAGLSLIKDLGIATDITTSVVDYLQGLVNPAIRSPSQTFLPRIEARLDSAARRAEMHAMMSPDRSQQLYEYLFEQLDRTAEADKTRQLSKISELGGPAADVALTSYSLVTRTGKGQSLEQAIAAESAGVALGTVAAAMVATGAKLVARTKGSGGPWGTAATFAVGAGFSAYGAVKGSDAVDQWYKDRDLERLVRNGYRENQQVQRSNVDKVEERY